MKAKHGTQVIFRTYKRTGEVIAYFPEWNESGKLISSYMHLGQHAPASYPNPATRPATPEEYASLYAELERIGYSLILRKNRRRRKMNTDIRPTLRVGCLAYYDSLSGLIPCKVLSISGENGHASSEQDVTVKLTANRKAYKRGEVITQSALWVIPRDAIFKRRYGARIGYYTVEVQA